jgi:hypothetical protein
VEVGEVVVGDLRSHDSCGEEWLPGVQRGAGWGETRLDADGQQDVVVRTRRGLAA